MTYEPREYWTNHPPLRRRPVHDTQEAALMDALGRIRVTSILEVGVGNGRIGKLLMERWPNATYTGLDISPARLAEARENLPERAELVEADLLEWDTDERSDLVVAVAVLMHVRPGDLVTATDRLKASSKRHVYTVDWTEPISKTPAPHNFRHDYEAVGFEIVAKVGRQSIHHIKV